ncbi:MAG: hypothetical protein BWK78_00520 [Thiotrichaceae bacterium IS1]|nr:MAG: hypothetical protein BWK78_00520 [Thiotrichaceae bacterium IS1]
MALILHITPHMGGGVGKALSGLVGQATQSSPGFEHRIICLESPQKSQFVQKAIDVGCKLTCCPSASELFEAIEQADIVQLEFWNHPAMLRALCSGPLPAMRLLIWCHVSGLYYPSIPSRLLTEAHQFLFTSPCSFEAIEVRNLEPSVRDRLGVVSSGGGFDTLPLPRSMSREELKVGYIGSLNFAKLHPEVVTFLAAVRMPEFCLRLIGDETNKVVLEKQCRLLGRPNLLEFRGYTTDIATELGDLDILVYLLNPKHYGTAENALLEAMAMGIVPIVLDNPAERYIVDNFQTGLVVHSPEELADTVDWLTTHRDEQLAMGQRAAIKVREGYTYKQIDSAFNSYYCNLMRQSKFFVEFNDIFGYEPADWFRAFYRNSVVFSDNGTVHVPLDQSCYALLERTKGSVFHFLDYFPSDARLKDWATNFEMSFS